MYVKGKRVTYSLILGISQNLPGTLPYNFLQRFILMTIYIKKSHISAHKATILFPHLWHRGTTRPGDQELGTKLCFGLVRFHSVNCQQRFLKRSLWPSPFSQQFYFFTQGSIPHPTHAVLHKGCGSLHSFASLTCDFIALSPLRGCPEDKNRHKRRDSGHLIACPRLALLTVLFAEKLNSIFLNSTH